MFRASNPARRLNLTLIACIFFGELLIMLLLPYFENLSLLQQALLDTFLLSCITVPVVFWTLNRPMNKSLMNLAGANNKVAIRENQMLASLNALAKARDNETGNHIIRTQHYVNFLALRLRSEGYYLDQLSDQSIAALVKAAPLHDIGKIGIPDNILLKDGSLTDSEWEIMKTHGVIGESVLDAAHIEQDGDSDVIAKAISIAGGHHEKWDGTGYPRGLAGEAIPLAARIMSLADVYDALVSKRVYKKAWTHEEAIQEIISDKGTRFDPLVADAFIAELEAFQEIAKTYQDG